MYFSYQQAYAEDLIDEFRDIIGEVIDFTKDSDGDGLADYYEKRLRYSNGVRIDTDPYNPDTDGLLDGEEIKIVTKEMIRDGEKYIKVYAKMLSHPKMIDTDGDGFSDYAEVKSLQESGNNTRVWSSSLKSNASLYKNNSTIEIKNPDPLKWNITDRHLALFAHLSYSDKPIKELYNFNKEQFLGLADINELDQWRILFQR